MSPPNAPATAAKLTKDAKRRPISVFVYQNAKLGGSKIIYVILILKVSLRNKKSAEHTHVEGDAGPKPDLENG